MPSNQLSDVEEEKIHFSNFITTFRNYSQYSVRQCLIVFHYQPPNKYQLQLAVNNRRRKDVYCLPSEDQQVLEAIGYKKKLDQVDDAIQANAEFLALIVANPDIFGHEVEADVQGTDKGVTQGGNEGEAECKPATHAVTSHSHTYSHSHSHSHTNSSHSHGHSHDRHQKYRPTDFDMDKLRSTLKQFVRGWSEQGWEEREACYQPMKDALVKHFSDVPLEQRGSLRVLLPGSGLGRLAYDVASMVLALHAAPIIPHTKSHRLDQQVPVVPICPQLLQCFLATGHAPSHPNPRCSSSNLPPGSDFSLVAGDFEEIYGVDTDPNKPQAGEWNAILTCFFIDTAKNIVNYLRVIHRILAPGGVWVNLGPLLWHWENNNTNDTSVELDLEEVKALARSIGFEISFPAP
ncbi:UPF0586 like protein [Termitomyces sp. T112]|nr:UPF0586 like protein [Termitomyces sp. T112]